VRLIFKNPAFYDDLGKVYRKIVKEGLADLWREKHFILWCKFKIAVWYVAKSFCHMDYYFFIDLALRDKRPDLSDRYVDIFTGDFKYVGLFIEAHKEAIIPGLKAIADEYGVDYHNPKYGVH